MRVGSTNWRIYKCVAQQSLLKISKQFSTQIPAMLRLFRQLLLANCPTAAIKREGLDFKSLEGLLARNQNKM